MARYIITHTDQNGEMHQLTGAWEAESASAALDQMFAESRGTDDGKWSAHVVTDDSDIIQ